MDDRLAAYIARLSKPAIERTATVTVQTWSSGEPFWGQIRSTGLMWRLGALLCAHALETGLVIASWVFIGSGALSGRLDDGRLAAWALCLASTVPLRLATTWWEGVLAVGVGGLLKQRLLAGALATDADVVRRNGIGELMGQVLEVETIDQQGVSGGLKTGLAALELLLVPVMLAWGVAVSLEIPVLVGWLGIAAIAIRANVRRRMAWTRNRLALTDRLVERMTAHRTRLAQQPSSQWHLDEDGELERYAAESKSLDRSTAWIEAVLPRGYIIAALLALTPSFLTGGATLTEQAVTLGGVLFAADALRRLASGIARGSAAWIAWRGAKTMVDATAGPVAAGSIVHPPAPGDTPLHAEGVTFTHANRVEPAVQGCTLTIQCGDVLLLEGDSGSGKSTLAAVLAGLRRPSHGVVLAGGLDLPTLGTAQWRRRIVAAPQYHENHILSASLGFNLLLGRPYPHSTRDLLDARAVCEDLGLGPVTSRMPGGLDQMVGESGWQLSHGERSRVFLARALLQEAGLVILDESLAALDPETLRKCLKCALRRSPSLLVIAHP